MRPSQQSTVIERDAEGQFRINRINYELCVLQALRDQLRCKEIWVEGAYRYRNPEADLPADFEVHRGAYYQALNQPLDVDMFIDTLRTEMTQQLDGLDRELPTNPSVQLLARNRGWIKLSPLKPQPVPSQLRYLRAEVGRLWQITNLLDVFKETDFQVGFTDEFRSIASRVILDPATRQKRLLLCLYGLGTNTGLKGVSMGDHGESYESLQYMRERFIQKESLQNAIARVANATLEVRHPHIWGESTMAVASDAHKFATRGETLKTEWHTRYRGRGVMVYWHVERKSLAIYSQVKSPSSSEVAAMLQGLVRHLTTMQIEKSYVDSHGQSEIAFAFCYLLGFDLLPRLKRIHAQKLYRPQAGLPDAYPHLLLVLTRPINWTLIRQQYDQMICYATALRLGTAEAEAILSRFTRTNLMHPTYQALLELGKAVKTVFLCRYLRSETLRQENQAGLSVVENWHSANRFIFYGHNGELTASSLANQEISALSLHLLQNSLVYINTLMLQHVLALPGWIERMTPDDWRGLTPLFYSHINPYGSFRLDMQERLPLLQPLASY